MNDLSTGKSNTTNAINPTNATNSANLTNQTNLTKNTNVTGGSGLQKEVEGGVGLGELPITDLGKEVVLPKEVAAVGVKQQPTVVQIPQPVAQMGVKPSGANVTIGTGKTITLPLTDDQIQNGLKKSITLSWRWLAEWCRRRLQQLLMK